MLMGVILGKLGRHHATARRRDRMHMPTAGKDPIDPLRRLRCGDVVFENRVVADAHGDCFWRFDDFDRGRVRWGIIGPGCCHNQTAKCEA